MKAEPRMLTEQRPETMVVSEARLVRPNELNETSKENNTSKIEMAAVDEENEKDTVVIQRRALRATRQMKKGELITSDCVEALRPCPKDALPPYEKDKLINKVLLQDIIQGDNFTWKSIS